MKLYTQINLLSLLAFNLTTITLVNAMDNQQEAKQKKMFFKLLCLISENPPECCTITKQNEIVHLIQKGAPVNFKNKEGYTPIFYVLNNPEALDALIKAGANVNVEPKSKNTPIFQLIKNYNPSKSLELLIKAEANINCINSEGETPLTFITSSYRLDYLFPGNLSAIIQRFKLNTLIQYLYILINYGANPNIKDKDDNSAFYYATGYEVKKILDQYKLRKQKIEESLNKSLIPNLINMVLEY